MLVIAIKEALEQLPTRRSKRQYMRCWKSKYSTFYQAHLAMEGATSNTKKVKGTRLYIYLCHKCSGYHIGSTSNKHKQVEKYNWRTN